MKYDWHNKCIYRDKWSRANDWLAEDPDRAVVIVLAVLVATFLLQGWLRNI